MTDDNQRLAAATIAQNDTQKSVSGLPTTAMLVLVVIINIIVLSRVSLPIIRPALGFWYVIVLPAYLVATTSTWRNCGLQERLGYSMCSVLLTLMLAGLGINEGLPLVGVRHPLNASSIMITSDLINASFYVYRSFGPGRTRLRTAPIRFSKQEFRLLVGAALTVVLAIFGANHLNNGASANITLIALAIMALVGVFSIRWLKFTREPVVSVVIYLVSLSLLLTTSLRGWYITGHDIQQEYLVFQLTESHSHWSMNYFHDPYNACLSITILPTELGQIIGVDSPYVFKLFFQLIFALCPVLAYAITRRYFDRGISTLSVAYFVSFPTFVTDTPFLNRQEIALLFVSVGLLAATNPAWTFRRRQIYLGIAGLGTEISHYSTMYVFVGTLILALLLSYAARFFPKINSTEDKTDDAQIDVQPAEKRWAPTTRGAVTAGLVTVFVSIIVAWGTLATRTTTQVLSDGKSAISAGSVSFSILPGATFSQESMLNNLRQEGLQARAEAAPRTYLPWSAVATAAMPIAGQQLTPLTAVGRGLNSAGIPVATINSLVHTLEADGEELFLAVGLIRLFVGGWRRGRIVGGQFFWLSAGCTSMIALITAFPSISADYGVLRAFQQGLLLFAPMIVIGSITIFAPMGQHLAKIAGCVVCLGVFLATSTLVPQVLGNNLAQLDLNNSGSYYDLYYKTSQETSASAWLDKQPDVLGYPIQASWDARRFLFTGPGIVNGNIDITDEYPTLVYQNSWVIIGNSTTRFGTAFSFDSANGGLIEYKYPVGVLNKYKNLVYTDGGAIIYK